MKKKLKNETRISKKRGMSRFMPEKRRRVTFYEPRKSKSHFLFLFAMKADFCNMRKLLFSAANLTLYF